MRNYLLAASFASALAFTSIATNAAPSSVLISPDITCRKRISGLIKEVSRSKIPNSCWHIGPLYLGETDIDVMNIMGDPDQTTIIANNGPDGRTYVAKIYAFPRNWASKLRSEPQGDLQLRFVEVLMYRNRVVQIANDPGTRVGNSDCDKKNHTPEVEIRGEPVGFRAFQKFAGIHIGMTVQHLTQRLGSAPNSNRSGDWRSYLPVPLAFSVDPDTQQIGGFEIGTDDSAVTNGAMADLTIHRDALTCRIESISFHSDGPHL